MVTNLLKIYPELLELNHLSEKERTGSLQAIFKRDIEDNTNFVFNAKVIRPIKGEEPEMSITFKHLTTTEIDVEENGRVYKKRIFEIDRSQRLHWIKILIENTIKTDLRIFSTLERNQKKRKDVVKTYIYDAKEKYVIILNPQRSQKDYYLTTAYYLNKDFGEKKLNKLWKNRLPELH